MDSRDVYEMIRTVPRGRVTTYGYIASLVGMPKNSRQVGYILKNLPSSGEWSTANVPWWRIVNARGGISPRERTDGVQRQAEMLLVEGVAVSSRGGETFVDMNVYGWT